MTNPLWSTAEAESWARDLGYEDYVKMCSHIGCKPLCEDSYELMCQAFDVQVESENNA